MPTMLPYPASRPTYEAMPHNVGRWGRKSHELELHLSNLLEARHVPVWPRKTDNETNERTNERVLYKKNYLRGFCRFFSCKVHGGGEGEHAYMSAVGCATVALAQRSARYLCCMELQWKEEKKEIRRRRRRRRRSGHGARASSLTALQCRRALH